MIFKFHRKARPNPTITEKPNTANNLSVLEGENEKCIICGCDTGIPFDTPISERKYYEPGSGQICETCYRKLYAKQNDSGKSFNTEMEALIRMCGKKEDEENF